MSFGHVVTSVNAVAVNAVESAMQFGRQLIFQFVQPLLPHLVPSWLWQCHVS